MNSVCVAVLAFACCCGAAESSGGGDPPAIVESVLSERDFSKLVGSIKRLRVMRSDEKIVVLRALVPHVSGDAAKELDNASDMVVLSRWKANPSSFKGHGLVLWQDVYIEGGRAAWVIEKLLGVRLPTVEARSTAAERENAKSVADAVVQAYEQGVRDGAQDRGRKRDRSALPRPPDPR